LCGNPITSPINQSRATADLWEFLAAKARTDPGKKKPVLKVSFVTVSALNMLYARHYEAGIGTNVQKTCLKCYLIPIG
jgi:hypothetical protein